tara:strand:+ start:342 stop:830 length:489 start_codon:yes stop_codon:yes gene_type:complete
MTKEKKFLKSIWILVVFLFCSCGGGSASTLPDAPPPYPGFPIPAQNPGAGVTEPYPSGSGYASSVPYIGTSNYSQSQTAVTPPVSARYMVKAKGNLWVLVQDQFGNEVDWRKLQAGDQFPINQAGSLTVTLSSSDKADILDSDNKKIEINSKNSGISIVRLP